MTSPERLRALAAAGDVDALHALARHHRRSGSLSTFLRELTPPRTPCGAFTPLGSRTGTRPALAGPHRDLLTLVRGTSTLAVYDAREDNLPEIARFRRLDSLFAALHPSGRRILTLNRDGTRLQLRDLDADTTLDRRMERPPNWDGRPLAPGEAPERWGYASEAITFTPEGHILYAGYEDHRARLFLLHGETLETLDATHLEAPTIGGEPTPLITWCEHIGFTSAPDGTQLIVLNAGDSLVAAYAFGVEGERITQHPALGEVLWRRFGEPIHSVTPSHDGRLLYIMDSDRILSVIAWPECELELRLGPVRPWRTKGFKLEFFYDDGRERERDLLVSDVLSLTEETILVTIVDYFSYETYGFAVLDAATMLPLGVLGQPRSRTPVVSIGGGLVVGCGRTTTRLWRFTPP